MENCHEITLEANPMTSVRNTCKCSPNCRSTASAWASRHLTTLRLLLKRRQCGSSHSCGRVVPCPRFPQHQHRPDLRAPGAETTERWEKDLQQAILDVEHISAYHLIYEEGTPIYKMLVKHQVEEVDEDSSVRFFTY